MGAKRRFRKIAKRELKLATRDARISANSVTNGILSPPISGSTMRKRHRQAERSRFIKQYREQHPGAESGEIVIALRNWMRLYIAQQAK